MAMGRGLDMCARCVDRRGGREGALQGQGQCVPSGTAATTGNIPVVSLQVVAAWLVDPVGCVGTYRARQWGRCYWKKRVLVPVVQETRQDPHDVVHASCNRPN